MPPCSSDAITDEGKGCRQSKKLSDRIPKAPRADRVEPGPTPDQGGVLVVMSRLSHLTVPPDRESLSLIPLPLPCLSHR